MFKYPDESRGSSTPVHLKSLERVSHIYNIHTDQSVTDVCSSPKDEKSRKSSESRTLSWVCEMVGCSYKTPLFLLSATTFGSYVTTEPNTTMLTFTQLIFSLCLTSISSGGAEKLFHSRDHSDIQTLTSHQAQDITDTYTAEVTAHCL